MRRVAAIVVAVVLVAVAALQFAPVRIGAQSTATTPAVAIFAVVASPAASPAASPFASPVANCAGVKAWLSATEVNLKQAATIIEQAANPATLSTAQLQDTAQKLSGLASTQQALGAPPAAKQLSMRVADVLRAYGDAATQVLNGVTNKDIDQISKGATMVNDANKQLAGINQELSRLAESCQVNL